jgi:alkylation response protein AidB-like acyl-CoA dehydrogenase
MTVAEPHPSATDDPLAEVRSWLEENWDPDLSVEQWWERLGLSGWSSALLPTNAYGRGLSRSDAVAVAREVAKFGAVGAPSGLGLLLAAPTIATHGTQAQIDRYVRDIVTGQQAWCQLFSEPGAGSDLAGLTTRAELDGDEWVVNGQKVWTSLGQSADMGMLIARTNVDVPKHQGITWMAVDMHQPGVEIRPLIEMTGHAMFNEVFLTDARVPVDAVIGDVGQGWAATNTTLQAERAGLGAGGGGAAGPTPGTIAGNLSKRVGDLAPKKRVPDAPDGAPKGAPERPRAQRSHLFDFAKNNGTINDPLIRQDLMRLHTLTTIGGYNAERVKAEKKRGRDIPGMANISKLMMSDVVRLQRDLGLRIIGANGMLHAYTDEQKTTLNEATGNPFLGMITGTALYAQAPPIYGGTDQIQKNIIGERALGLPKEPNNDKTLPFSELPKNA